MYQKLCTYSEDARKMFMWVKLQLITYIITIRDSVVKKY
jgi:hypothetical protein